MSSDDVPGVDPSIWSNLVAAVAALAGVLLGRATTRSESRITREDEYRREARTSAVAVFAAIRSHKKELDLLRQVVVGTSAFGLLDTDVGERFSECETSWTALNDQINEFLFLVGNDPLRRAALAFQRSARQLHSEIHGLVYQHYNTESERASLRSSVMEEREEFNTTEEHFYETCWKRLSHVITEERERGTLPSRIRGCVQQQRLSIPFRRHR